MIAGGLNVKKLQTKASSFEHIEYKLVGKIYFPVNPVDYYMYNRDKNRSFLGLPLVGPLTLKFDRVKWPFL